MSEPEINLETTRQRDIRLLRILEEDDLTNFSTPNSSAKDLLALKNLLNEFLIEAVLIQNGSGFPVQFLNAQITIKGRSFLEELEQKESRQIALPEQVETLKLQIKDLNETEHTLLNYWKLADWSERFGMVSFYGLVFMVGYLCSKTEAISHFIDLIRGIKP